MRSLAEPGCLCLMLAALASAAEDRYAGAKACGACHPKHYASQSASTHALSLHRSQEISKFPYLPEGRAGEHHEFRKTDAGYWVTVKAGGSQMEIPIHWILGANDQGLTFFSRLGAGEYLEHRLSYYTRKGGYDVTAGHAATRPGTLEEALGARMSPAEAFRCLACHSTSLAQTASGPDFDSVVAGVTCERCHGPGAAHVEAMKSGSKLRQIRNPGKLPGERLVSMCGECHRTEPPPGVAFDDPIVTRFQPVGLQMSACFSSSDGALTCTTCHNPHENARRGDDRYYEQKCLACHNPQTGKQPRPPLPPDLKNAGRQRASGALKASSPVPGKPCRTQARAGCIGCHMPKTKPLAWVEFTDHWIRARK
ncbi:MAG: hypothetical protein FJW37_12525 [Acidobacteria bacterium]|nr:hypothetical protein [Acidobacteriota bacterium]